MNHHIAPALFGILIGACGMTLISCGLGEPTIVDKVRALQTMEFARHANGQCFGILGSRTYSGYIVYAVTLVPEVACD